METQSRLNNSMETVPSADTSHHQSLQTSTPLSAPLKRTQEQAMSILSDLSDVDSDEEAHGSSPKGEIPKKRDKRDPQQQQQQPQQQQQKQQQQPQQEQEAKNTGKDINPLLQSHYANDKDDTKKLIEGVEAKIRKYEITLNAYRSMEQKDTLAVQKRVEAYRKRQMERKEKLDDICKKINISENIINGLKQL